MNKLGRKLAIAGLLAGLFGAIYIDVQLIAFAAVAGGLTAVFPALFANPLMAALGAIILGAVVIAVLYPLLPIALGVAGAVRSSKGLVLASAINYIPVTLLGFSFLGNEPSDSTVALVFPPMSLFALASVLSFVAYARLKDGR